MRVLICAAPIVIGLVCVAHAQTVYVGPQGQPLGQSYQSGNQTIYMGPQGQPLGSSYNCGSPCGPQPVIVMPQDTPFNSALKAQQQVQNIFEKQERIRLLRQQRRQQEGR